MGKEIPTRILQALQDKAQETIQLLLNEAGGDLRLAAELWELVKKQRALTPPHPQMGEPMAHGLEGDLDV